MALTVVCFDSPLHWHNRIRDWRTLAVHWTDLALIVLAIASAVTYACNASRSAAPVRVGIVLAAPMLVVVFSRAGWDVLLGASLSTIGTGLRVYAWYLGVILFAAIMASPPMREKVISLILALASLASVLVIVSNALAGVGSVIALAIGSRLVVLPGSIRLSGAWCFPG